jgi:hypothetical protein
MIISIFNMYMIQTNSLNQCVSDVWECLQTRIGAEINYCYYDCVLDQFLDHKNLCKWFIIVSFAVISISLVYFLLFLMFEDDIFAVI